MKYYLINLYKILKLEIYSKKLTITTDSTDLNKIIDITVEEKPTEIFAGCGYRNSWIIV